MKTTVSTNLKETRKDVKSMNNIIKGNRILGEGIVVSNDTRKTFLNNNDLICGGSGSGKTSGYISHNLANPSGSYIVSDTKGQLFKKHAKHLKEKGYEVKVVDFVNPERSCHYNPLRYIRRDKKGRIYEKDILKLAYLIAPSQDNYDKYWDNSARRFIATLISYVLENENIIHPNMIDVVNVFSNYVEKKEESGIAKWSVLHSKSLTAKKFSDMENLASSEKTNSCVLDFVSQALDRFRYAEFEMVFDGKDEVDLSSVGKKKTVIFLNVSDNDTSFHVFSNIFNMQALQTLIEEADKQEEGSLPVPVRIILDDFAAGPMVEDFDNVISIIRSREISVSVIVQSVGQLYSKYSEHVANTIMANCDHKIFLSCGDEETARYISLFTNKPISTMLNLSFGKEILVTTGEGVRFANKLSPYGMKKDPADSIEKNL